MLVSSFAILVPRPSSTHILQSSISRSAIILPESAFSLVPQLTIINLPLPALPRLPSWINRGGQAFRQAGADLSAEALAKAEACRRVRNSLCPQFTPIDHDVFCRDVFQSG
jgi:hypothetical protein